MRVGLVCPYSFSRPGGVQSHVWGLGEYLAGRGHEVEVLAPGVPTRGTSRRPQPGFTSAGPTWPVPANGSVARISFTPRTATLARRWLARGRFDVVHLHEPLVPSIASQVLTAARVPVVATMHAAREDPRLALAAARVWARRLRRIDVPLAVSAAAGDLAQTYLPERPRIVPNGLWVDDFSSTTAASPAGSCPPVGSASASSSPAGSCPPVGSAAASSSPAGSRPPVGSAAASSSPAASRPPVGSAAASSSPAGSRPPVGPVPALSPWRGGARPRVTFMGRDEPRKGLDILLAAVPAIRAAIDVDIVVAGPEGRELPASCRRLDARDDAARARLLAETDVFVSPALGGESFGIVLVEALAAGCQVVASDLPPFAAVLGDAGTTFPTGDPAGLAAAVVDRLRGPVPARVRAARAARFDWACVGEEVLEAYADALSR